MLKIIKNFFLLKEKELKLEEVMVQKKEKMIELNKIIHQLIK